MSQWAISIIVPVMDEQDTLGELTERIFKVAEDCASVASAEIVFVDDGSRDRSWQIMEDLANKHVGRVRAVRMRRNFGKSIALEAGWKQATGDIIFTMDADLQDDPKEIPRFLQKIDEGFDLVSGWKRTRHDPLSKTLPSRLFNKATAKMTGVPLHDFNCGFKAYRREVVERLRIYGDLHRYIPVFANDAGFRVGEIEVEHHPRMHGVSKYGFERYARGLLDLITILATTRYLQRPGHLFGGLGVLFGLVGAAILGYLATIWLFGAAIGHRPLFFLGFLFMIFSIQMISLGVLAELLVRLLNPRNVDDLVVADVYAPSAPSQSEPLRQTV